MAKKNRKILKKMKKRRGRLARQREGNSVIFQTISSRDVPVAENGYRIVGPAQAMMDYAKPLMDKVDSIDKVLSIAQLCWNLALVKDPKEQAKIKKEVVLKIDQPDAESFVDFMIERHKKMFPELGKTISFYIKERVIDEPVDFEPFDESTLNLSDEIFPATKTEIRFAGRLKDIDASILDGSWEQIEKSFYKFQDKIAECYQDWCIKKGVPEHIASDFSFAAQRFLDFVYEYGNGTLSTIPKSAVREFMRSFFIRKCVAPPEVMSTMPTAVKLFMQYLDEKGIVTDTNRITRIVEAEKETFGKNLRDYNNPQASF